MARKSAANTFVKECIVTALRTLMEEKEYHEISISDITRKAGVSRMAYYRNYTSKEDIIEKTLDEHALITDQYTIPLYEAGNMEGYMEYLFTDFANQADFYACIQRARLGDMILRYFNRCTIQFVARYQDPDPLKYQILAISGSVYNMAITWIMEGLRETPKEMALLFLRTVNREMLYQVLPGR